MCPPVERPTGLPNDRNFVDTPGLAAMRRRFLRALDDPDHPVWDRLLFGIAGGASGIVEMMERHPFGHDCQQCEDWRSGSISRKDGLAQIEADVLARRGEPYEANRRRPTLRDTA